MQEIAPQPESHESDAAPLTSIQPTIEEAVEQAVRAADYSNEQNIEPESNVKSLAGSAGPPPPPNDGPNDNKNTDNTYANKMPQPPIDGLSGELNQQIPDLNKDTTKLPPI
jgi:hypothetical protein